MSVLDNFSSAVSKAGRNTKKAIDLRVLIKRIKNYEAEEKTVFMEMGRVYYHRSGREDGLAEKRLAELAESVDNIRFRINQLSKQYGELKLSTVQETPDESAVQGLSKNEGDIRIRRTSNGITLVRACPGCKTENPSSAENCHKCGKALKTV